MEGEDRADHSLACSRGSQLLDPEASTWRTEVGSHTWWPVCYCVALHPREHLDRLAYDGGFLRGATEGSPQPLSSGEMFMMRFLRDLHAASGDRGVARPGARPALPMWMGASSFSDSVEPLSHNRT